MKLVVDFAQHHGRQAVHARFDVRAIHHDAVPDGVQDHLGSLLGSSSSEGPVTVEAKMCLPRDQGYVLVASGNATRGSSFDRFNVTVINEEYLGLVAFRAGSDWTRGSSFRSDRLAAAAETSATLGVMATEDPHSQDYEVEFFEDEGVGPPLFESIDGGKTYRLHGRARFDVWPEAPIDANGVWTECGVLAAVSVGATSYGNGAAPRAARSRSARRPRHGRQRRLHAHLFAAGRRRHTARHLVARRRVRHLARHRPQHRLLAEGHHLGTGTSARLPSRPCNGALQARRPARPRERHLVSSRRPNRAHVPSAGAFSQPLSGSPAAQGSDLRLNTPAPTALALPLLASRSPVADVPAASRAPTAADRPAATSRSDTGVSLHATTASSPRHSSVSLSRHGSTLLPTPRQRVFPHASSVLLSAPRQRVSLH